MADEGGFALVLKGQSTRQTALGGLAGTLTFETLVKDKEEWEELVKAVTAKAKFYVYGSFEDEIAAVLRADRDKWKRRAEAQQMRIDYLESKLEDMDPSL